LVLLVDAGWSHAQLNCPGTGMKAAIPGSDDQVRIFGGKGAGKMDGLGASKRVITRKLTGVSCDRLGEFDRTGRSPVLLPSSFRGGEIPCREIVFSRSGGKGRPHFRKCKSARHGSIASVPQLRGQHAPFLFNEELHERTRVEIDQSHESATLLADQVSHIHAGTWSATARRRRPLRLFGPGNDALNSQAFKSVSGIDSAKSGDGDAPVRDNDFGARPGVLKPFAQMRS
jgi:hypothetical protein